MNHNVREGFLFRARNYTPAITYGKIGAQLHKIEVLKSSVVAVDVLILKESKKQER